MQQSPTYEYSRVHRALELGAIGALPLMLGAMVHKSLGGLDYESPWLGLAIAAAVLAGFIAADFVSGLVHFAADTYGDENTPLLGPNFIKPFRDHHTDPKGITRHDFVEINGNNCIVCLPAGLCAYYGLAADTNPYSALGLLFVASMLLCVFLTNQFHRWAHEDEPPLFVTKLQAWNLVLPRDHHDVHHVAPHDKYYCITVGWLNPILYHLRFFEAIRRVVYWLTPKSSRPHADLS
jgi:plasmanylethanolamine desaturase